MSNLWQIREKIESELLYQVYNASNNELVRTNTLVKGAIIQIDATPFRQWYEAHVRKALIIFRFSTFRLSFLI